MKAEDLRHQFHNEEGISWENSQGEPDIDYVMWLEHKVLRPEVAEMPTEDIEELLKRIDKDVEKPMVTAQFGDMWKSHAVEHYDFPSIVNIAWRQGRRALLLEKELRNRIKMPSEEEQELKFLERWILNFKLYSDMSAFCHGFHRMNQRADEIRSRMSKPNNSEGGEE